MKKFFIFILLVGICGFFTTEAWAAKSMMTRTQYKKNLTYNKNALPVNWQYEAGYTLWRMERGLSANRQTYRKYTRDRAWRNNLHRYSREEEIVLDSLDWTTEEIALFWKNYEELFRFHPAGRDD